METTEEKRKRLLEGLAKLLPHAQPIRELPKDAAVVVMRVEDFNPSDNDVWEIQANKSYPRDVNCGTCSKQVVMSGGAFDMYEKSNREREVICGKCLLERLEKESTS